MKFLKLIIGLLISIVPTSHARIFLYRTLLGYKIEGKSSIGPLTVLIAREVDIQSGAIGPLNIIRVEKLRLKQGALIGKFNMFSKLKAVHLAKDACILHRNFIGGTYGTTVQCDREELLIGERSQISLSCFIDVSDRIKIGQNVVIAGAGTQMWTHGFNHFRERDTAAITIQDDVFIGAASTIVQGIQICSSVTVGAGTVVHRNIAEPGLYVSSSLRKVRK